MSDRYGRYGMSDREDIWENGQIVGYRNVVNNVDTKLREPDDPPVSMSKRIISDKKAYEIMAENDKLKKEVKRLAGIIIDEGAKWNDHHTDDKKKQYWQYFALKGNQAIMDLEIEDKL